MRTRTWLLLCSVLVLAAGVIGVGIGIVFPRVSLTGTPVTPAGVQVEELEPAEELFSLAGEKAQVFKYSGGDVEFWVELDAGGKKNRIGLGFPDSLEPPPPGQTVEGYFIWNRSEPDDAGRESWRVAHRRDLVTREASGVQVSSPLHQFSYSKSQWSKGGFIASRGEQVRVWTVKKPDGEGTSGSSLVRNPLPVDQEVCLKEIREDGDYKNSLAVLGAGTLGVSLSPGGPVTAASAVPLARVMESRDKHTIRLMCKVVSAKDKPAANPGRQARDVPPRTCSFDTALTSPQKPCHGSQHHAPAADRPAALPAHRRGRDGGPGRPAGPVRGRQDGRPLRRLHPRRPELHLPQVPA
jgi:hypothetical protein